MTLTDPDKRENTTLLAQLAAVLPQLPVALSPDELAHIAQFEQSLLFRHLPLAIAVIDHAQNRFLHVGKGAQQLLSFAPESLVAIGPKGFAQHICADDRPAFFDCLSEAMRQFVSIAMPLRASACASFVYRFTLPDGTLKPLMQQTIPLRTTPEGYLHLNLSLVYDLAELPLKAYGTASFRYINDSGKAVILPLTASISESTRLSERERAILLLVIDGYSSKQIAIRLNLSPHTVNTHRKNILRKSGANNTADLVRRAVQLGWV